MGKNIFDENNIDRSNIGIEMTERVLFSEGKKLNGILTTMQAMGYLISIDDFGTGYNSLKNIVDIKADIIKIDKYFVDRIDQKNIKSLVRHIIAAMHEMGFLLVAEGVETKEQLMTLKELGCNQIQGYYFSKPLLPDDFADYYKSFDMNKYI